MPSLMDTLRQLAAEGLERRKPPKAHFAALLDRDALMSVAYKHDEGPPDWPVDPTARVARDIMYSGVFEHAIKMPCDPLRRACSARVATRRSSA